MTKNEPNETPLVTPRPGLFLCYRSSIPYETQPCDESFQVRTKKDDRRTRWAVEIADIVAFVDKHGRCVVDRDFDGFCTVEIYDDYRE